MAHKTTCFAFKAKMFTFDPMVTEYFSFCIPYIANETENKTPMASFHSDFLRVPIVLYLAFFFLENLVK